MNPDPFERRLGRQPIRPLPAQWREEILAVARHEGLAPDEPAGTPPRALLDWVRWFLWPAPAAWASLALAWGAIVALDHASRPEPPPGTSLLATTPPLSAPLR